MSVRDIEQELSETRYPLSKSMISYHINQMNNDENYVYDFSYHHKGPDAKIGKKTGKKMIFKIKKDRETTAVDIAND